MDEREFNLLADEVLAKIETAADASGIDCNRSGNVLEIECENGAKIIVNRHDINREIWIAARSGGFHFSYQDGAWISQRDQAELYAKMKALLSELGEAISF